ncbi:hypothetical protein D3C80_1842150 [compost metagenome]
MIVTDLFGRQRRGEGVEDGIHISHSLGFEKFTGEAGLAGTVQDGVDKGLVLGRSGPAQGQGHA